MAWVDRSLRKLPIDPALLHVGTNEVHLRCRYDADHPGLEILYLLGDFGVRVKGADVTMAVEKLYAHYKHPRTSILMAHARGAILLAAEQAGVAIHSLPATKVKKSLTGNGHASKRQMQRAIQILCNLDTLPEPPDVADAIAIALCAGKLLHH